MFFIQRTCKYYDFKVKKNANIFSRYVNRYFVLHNRKIKRIARIQKNFDNVVIFIETTHLLYFFDIYMKLNDYSNTNAKLKNFNMWNKNQFDSILKMNKIIIENRYLIFVRIVFFLLIILITFFKTITLIFHRFLIHYY